MQQLLQMYDAKHGGRHLALHHTSRRIFVGPLPVTSSSINATQIVAQAAVPVSEIEAAEAAQRAQRGTASEGLTALPDRRTFSLSVDDED